MEKNTNQYKRIISVLKKSEPELTHGEVIEEKVMERIQQKRRNSADFNFFDYLFGWVYIGWVRKSLVVASILIIGLFAFQQSLILKRINSLEHQTITTGSSFTGGTTNEIESTLMLFKRSGTMLQVKNSKLSEKQIRQVIESVNKLQDQYQDLLKLVDDNPELKQYIEKRLSEIDKKKFNL